MLTGVGSDRWLVRPEFVEKAGNRSGFQVSGGRADTGRVDAGFVASVVRGRFHCCPEQIR